MNKTTPAKIHPIYLKASKGEYVTHADLAKLIRTALATQFPGTKFSVTTKTYSGGGSVSVSYVDGPSCKDVTHAANQFSTKSFDGSIDMAHHCSLWLYPDGSAHTAHDRGTEGSLGSAPEVIESAKNGTAILLENVAGSYISVSRSFSAAKLKLAIQAIKDENWVDLQNFDWSQVEVIEGEYQSYTKGAGSAKIGCQYLDHLIWKKAGEL